MEALLHLTAGVGVDRAIDAVGIDAQAPHEGPGAIDEHFPIGMAMNKNLTIKMGNCNHRRYLTQLVRRVKSGEIDPVKILTQRQPIMSVLEAYKQFDQRKADWLKVELTPTVSLNPKQEKVV